MIKGHVNRGVDWGLWRAKVLETRKDGVKFTSKDLKPLAESYKQLDDKYQDTQASLVAKAADPRLEPSTQSLTVRGTPSLPGHLDREREPGFRVSASARLAVLVRLPAGQELSGSGAGDGNHLHLRPCRRAAM